MDRFTELAEAHGLTGAEAQKIHENALQIVDLMKHAVLINIGLATLADELLYAVPEEPGLDGQRFRDLIGWTDLYEVRSLLQTSVMPIGTSPSNNTFNGLAEVHQLRPVDRDSPGELQPEGQT